MKKLHDDWERIGPYGANNGHTLTVGPRDVWVNIRDDNGAMRKYRLDRVYAQLVRDAYFRGLAQKPLVP